MKREVPRRKFDVAVDIDSMAQAIAQIQKENGEIPWSRDGKADPWDHVEAAMGLCIAGNIDEARRAYEWLAGIQLEDGSWYAAYLDGKPLDKTRDTNITAYIAVGLFQFYLITKDIKFLKRMWGVLSAAIDFAVSLQAPSGEIYWAKSPDLQIDRMALLTGSSSIYMSIKCALAAAQILGYQKPEWKIALDKLGNAIRNGYHLFNMTKSRFSMDWFYPVLSGAITGQDARKRIDHHWKKFVVEGMGILCVSDRPWVTIAETSELVIALSALGNYKIAEIIFNWICERKFEDGSYWCGFTFPDMVIWPDDKISWTNGVVIMAADALYQISSASSLFSHKFWEESEYAAALR